MSYRSAFIVAAAISIWGFVALTTGLGLTVFLSPGDLIADALLPHTPGTYTPQSSTGPDQAIVELAFTLGLQSALRALWWSIAFWLIFSVTVGALVHRIRRVAPNKPLERMREG